MKKIIYTILILAVLLGIALLINKKEVSAPTDENVGNSNGNPTLCFIYNTEGGDHLTLKLHVLDDNKVEGSFIQEFAGKDKKSGEFSGTAGPLDPEMMARKADTIWTVTGEGVTNKEELLIIWGEGTASPAFGEMKDNGKGVYVYANPLKVTYPINLSDTDCNDPAVQK